MKLEDLTTIDQLTEFLSGTQAAAFSLISDNDDCYRWIQRELPALFEWLHGRAEKPSRPVIQAAGPRVDETRHPPAMGAAWNVQAPIACVSIRSTGINSTT